MNAESRLGVMFMLTLLVSSAIVLTAALPTFYFVAKRPAHDARSAVADSCAVALRSIDSRDSAATRAVLAQLIRRHNLASLSLASRDQIAIPGDEAVELRTVADSTLEVRFRGDDLVPAVSLLRVAIGSGFIAAVAGLLLLMTNVKALLATWTPQRDAGTFAPYESSIRTLRGLRDQEKVRADELGAVTATLVRNLTSGFIAVDEHGLVVDVNPTARELLGMDPTLPAGGRAIREALGQTPFADTLEEAVRTRSTLQRQEIALGEGRVLGLTTVSMADEADRYLGMFALFTDLTPMRKLEVRLREMQSLADLGEMSAGLAHEFRNSLSTILGYLQLARRGAPPPEIDERVRRAEDEARLLSSAVESLLSFTRPLALQLQPMDARELARDVAAQLAPAAGDIGIEVRGPALHIEGDAPLLRRAIENILRNAFDAIREKGGPGHIDIESSAAPIPLLTIRDNGVGLDPAAVPRLFLPFQSTKPNGFGLGLALARKIILLHGGAIRLGGRPGEGAVVTIEFPARGE